MTEIDVSRLEVAKNDRNAQHALSIYLFTIGVLQARYPRLHAASRVAAVAARRVAIVTRFAAEHQAIAALGDARPLATIGLGLAVRRAAIGRSTVAVVTPLGTLAQGVTARGRATNARRAL